MNRELVLMLTLTLLVGTLSVAPYVQKAGASGTIYIRADGSIDPPDAPISTVDKITYTFAGDINDSIVVERDNIVVDGAGYMLQGTDAYDSRGTDVTGRSNVTIKNTNIKNYWCGIYLNSSSNYNSISGNNITNNEYGIGLDSSSSYNSISGNDITANNYSGIWLAYSSSYNSISGNNITHNGYGIYLYYSSSYNSIFHNNFINNAQQVYSNDSVNVWDDGYPSGGNCWSDYTGIDAYSGPYQNITGSDGIGDSPYVIDENNQDRYPLGVFGVPLIGDLNQDGIVNVLDAIQAASAFGSYPGHPNWNSQADVNQDNIVNILDIIILANNFGKH